MAKNNIIRNLLSSLIVSAPLLTPSLGTAKNIIFDLGEIIIEPNSKAATQEIGGYSSIISCAIFDGVFHWQNPLPSSVKQRLKKRFFTVLNNLSPLEQISDKLTPHYHGHIIPMIMRSWLRGTIDSESILTKTLKFINDPKNHHLFISNRERMIVAHIARLTFDPKTLAKTRQLIPDGYQLVHDCYNMRKTSGKRKHKLYVLSNWDTESFEYLVEKFPELFEMFDGIMISGHIGEMKPFDGIYTTFMSKFNLNPEDCIFIDDQHENIVAARKHFKDNRGQRCLHCPGGLNKDRLSVGIIRKQLRKLAVL